jgi:Flp pilus assembly protein CpaB
VKNHRGRGQVTIAYLLMAAVAALLVVVLAVRQVTRATTTEVWTAKSALKAGQKIEAGHLTLARVARNAIPAGAITNPAAILGRVLQTPVAQGAPLTMQEFASQGQQKWLSDAPEPGRSVMAVRLAGAIVPTKSFRYNDRVDILAIDRSGESTIVARDARYIGAMNANPPAKAQSGLAEMVASAGPKRQTSGVIAMVLSLRQQDVETVAAAEGSGKRLQFALHGINEPPYVPVAAKPTTEGPTIDLILGSTREKVTVIR